jgi:hypothetical protein
MLIGEVSICRSVNESEAIGLLQKALTKAFLTLPPAL